jgi:spoIIIJ-associated protein
MDLNVKIEEEKTEDAVCFNLVGENLGVLIGKHGQTLDALQYLVNLAANRSRTEDRVYFILDIEKYRERREETLCHLAARLADKVSRSGDKIVLEPMNRHERKIIHVALQNDKRVRTYSAGEEPFRKVVIEANRPKR